MSGSKLPTLSDNGLTRRHMIQTGATITAGILAASPTLAASAQTQTKGNLKNRAFFGGHDLKPLPYDPAKLKGISQRLIESHWSNNYGGSVRSLNETNRRLGVALTDPDVPAFIYNDLKREHLMRTGSVVLHELYFENLGGDGVPSSSLRTHIANAFGTFERWETEFRRIASGLGGGSGWVLFGYNHQFGALENYWMADHMHSPVTTSPLLVLDMYEHAYHMDHGAETNRYIDAFFNNINWDIVSERFGFLL